MEQNIIILSADCWKMTDEKTGEIREGCSIHYIPSLEKCCNEEGKSYGYKPVKESLPVEFINQIKAVGGCPCDAKASFVIRLMSGNQVLKIGQCEVLGKK